LRDLHESPRVYYFWVLNPSEAPGCRRSSRCLLMIYQITRIFPSHPRHRRLHHLTTCLSQHRKIHMDLEFSADIPGTGPSAPASQDTYARPKPRAPRTPEQAARVRRRNRRTEYLVRHSEYYQADVHELAGQGIEHSPPGPLPPSGMASAAAFGSTGPNMGWVDYLSGEQS
jgi:hypothetical protein